MVTCRDDNQRIRSDDTTKCEQNVRREQAAEQADDDTARQIHVNRAGGGEWDRAALPPRPRALLA